MHLQTEGFVLPSLWYQSQSELLMPFALSYMEEKCVIEWHHLCWGVTWSTQDLDTAHGIRELGQLWSSPVLLLWETQCSHSSITGVIRKQAVNGKGAKGTQVQIGHDLLDKCFELDEIHQALGTVVVLLMLKHLPKPSPISWQRTQGQLWPQQEGRVAQVLSKSWQCLYSAPFPAWGFHWGAQQDPCVTARVVNPQGEALPGKETHQLPTPIQ